MKNDEKQKHNWIRVILPDKSGRLTYMACSKCGCLLGDQDSDICPAIILSIIDKFNRDSQSMVKYSDINRFMSFLSNKAMKIKWNEDVTEISILLNGPTKKELLGWFANQYFLTSSNINQKKQGSLYGFPVKLVNEMPENMIGVYNESESKFIACMVFSEINDSHIDSTREASYE
jgi:hypothetical protein